MLKYITVVLRIEKGFPNSFYDTDDQAHNEYTKYHRMLVSSFAAYDVKYDIYGNSKDPLERFEKVSNGLVRSSTLSIVLKDLKDAPLDKDWIEIRDYLGISEEAETLSDWRIEKDKNDKHHLYDKYGVWSATRNLLRVNEVRVRERYTFTANTQTRLEDITAAIEGNVDIDQTSGDILLATATVYALNKATAKPQVAEQKTDWSEWPIVVSIPNQK
jgi:hypothetical protein